MKPSGLVDLANANAAKTLVISTKVMLWPIDPWWLARIGSNGPTCQTVPSTTKLPVVRIGGHAVNCGLTVGRRSARHGYGPRWPDFGRIAALNAVTYCALLSSISAGQLMYRLVANAPTTLYGSEGWGFESLRARPGQRLCTQVRRTRQPSCTAAKYSSDSCLTRRRPAATQSPADLASGRCRTDPKRP